jgi:serine/threonine protein kinase
LTVPELAPGRIIGGKYTLQALLQRHSWVATYRAITSPNREVVVKVFDPALAARSDVLREIQRAEMAGAAPPAHLSLPVVEQGVDPELGVPYIVTPLAAAPSLGQLVELCALSPAETVALLQYLGRALDAAHFAGYQHLALKPTNIFVGPAPLCSVQVCDFGANATRALVTEEARLLFSAPWLAPEQVTGDARAGPDADVFSAALVAFFALTGRSLWQSCRGASPDLGEWRLEIARPPPRVSEAANALGIALAPALDDAFASALASPPLRPKSVGAFARQLAEALGLPLAPSVAPPNQVPANDLATPVSLPPDAIEPESEDPPHGTLHIPTLAPVGAPMPPPPTPDQPSLATAGPVQATAPPDLLRRPGTLPYWEPSVIVDPSAIRDAAPDEAVERDPFPAPPHEPSTSVAVSAALGTTGEEAPSNAPAGTRRAKMVLVAAAAFVVALAGIAGAAVLVLAPGTPGASSQTPASSGVATAPVAPPVAAASDSVPPVPAAPASVAEGPSPIPSAGTLAAAPPDVPAPATGRPDDGELTVICEPACDVVALDSRPMEGYPRPVPVRPGSHGVGASRARYGGQWKQVTVRPGEKATLTFKLSPLGGDVLPKKPCGQFLKRCKD